MSTQVEYLQIQPQTPNVHAAIGTALENQCSIDVPVQAMLAFHPLWFGTNVTLDVYLEDEDTYRRSIPQESGSNSYDPVSFLGLHQHIAQFPLDVTSVVAGQHAML